jgi:predicted flap endonuclease-1-like 5' DNA nuclease
MSARSLIQKIKQVVGLSDGSGSESETGPSTPEETDVTVEREPESTDRVEPETEPTTATESGTQESESAEEIQAERGESVEKIKGIGPTYRDRLESGGLGTVPELAESDPETVAETAQTSEGRAEEWIKRAKNR